MFNVVFEIFFGYFINKNTISINLAIKNNLYKKHTFKKKPDFIEN